MKKFLIIGLIVALVLIVVGGAGLVFARVQGTNNATVVTINGVQNQGGGIRTFRNGPGGMMGGWGYGPGGMMGGNRNGYGPFGMMGGCGKGGGRGLGIMHDYMISAFASAVGLSVEQVDTRIANGETLDQIAIAQGTTQANLPALVAQVVKAALDKAVADGVITQTQADQMLKNMNTSNNSGFGFSFGINGCPMWEGNGSK